MPERTTDAAASEPENSMPEPEAPIEEPTADVPEGETDVPVGDAQGTDVPVGDAQGTDVPEGDAQGTDVPEGETDVPVGDAQGTDVPEGETADPAPTTSGMPEYKGEPLEAERGPGLGCFWIQIALLTFFLVFTPLTVTWGWPSAVSAALLIFTLILLLFSGQTIIFLLRLVAADRRTRRAPLKPTAKPTVGQMEDVVPRAGTDPGHDTDEPEPAASEEKPADG